MSKMTYATGLLNQLQVSGSDLIRTALAPALLFLFACTLSIHAFFQRCSWQYGQAFGTRILISIEHRAVVPFMV